MGLGLPPTSLPQHLSTSLLLSRQKNLLPEWVFLVKNPPIAVGIRRDGASPCQEGTHSQVPRVLTQQPLELRCIQTSNVQLEITDKADAGKKNHLDVGIFSLWRPKWRQKNEKRKLYLV